MRCVKYQGPLLLILAALVVCGCDDGKAPAGYGIAQRPRATAYLSMPPTAAGPLPALLSQTGAFADTAAMKPAPALIAYEVNAPLWSDGAEKYRWISVPWGKKITFAAEGPWTFPKGTVLVKHFDLVVDHRANPPRRQRIETRLLVCDAQGGIYGASYRWRTDQADAELVRQVLREDLPIHTAQGQQTQTWLYPDSRQCLICHTPVSGIVLGVQARQLNRPVSYPSGITDQQLRAWNGLRLLKPALDESAIGKHPQLVDPADAKQPLEQRVRSYLDANCSSCHLPGVTVAKFDARFQTPLARQGLIGGRVVNDMGIKDAAVVVAGRPQQSVLLQRLQATDPTKMPPLGREVVDPAAVELMAQWIASLAARP